MTHALRPGLVNTQYLHPYIVSWHFRNLFLDREKYLESGVKRAVQISRTVYGIQHFFHGMGREACKMHF